ncbi:MAG: methyltransferase domain-containing protein [Candidatus Buchananbacteria bacterium]|nr:methyltransferase domain-containing protein [Candidatus Buchananbacteria bacterium]
MTFLYLFLTLALLIFLYLLIFRYKVPWVPIWQKDLDRLNELIELSDNKVFYDLGCGNGRVLFYFAQKYPQVNFIGIELSLILYFICQFRKYLGRYENVKIKLGDYMKTDLNQADYVFVFANQEPMQQIGAKIEKKVHKNLILISYCFEINNWQDFLIKKDKPSPADNIIYIYQYQKKKKY